MQTKTNSGIIFTSRHVMAGYCDFYNEVVFGLRYDGSMIFKTLDGTAGQIKHKLDLDELAEHLCYVEDHHGKCPAKWLEKEVLGWVLSGWYHTQFIGDTGADNLTFPDEEE